MKIVKYLGSCAFFFFALFNSLDLSRAEEYVIDSSHSSVGFKIKHLAISNVRGGFTEFEGKYFFDPKDVASAKAQAVIRVASIDTANAKRDDHLRNPDFFDVAKFAEIKFVSTKVTPIKEGEFRVLGDLTMRGITRPVELTVSYKGAVKDPWGKERTGFAATGMLNRKDFGLTWSKALETGGLVVADEVEIAIEVEGIKAQ